MTGPAILALLGRQALPIGLAVAFAVTALTAWHFRAQRDAARLDAAMASRAAAANAAALAQATAEHARHIAALTDEEARELAARIDALPAGGDGVGSVVGALVLVFIILLITDLLGWTKVFPFTRTIR